MGIHPHLFKVRNMERKRITISINEDVARELLDKKQALEDEKGLSLSVSAFIAMLIKSYGQDA